MGAGLQSKQGESDGVSPGSLRSSTRYDLLRSEQPRVFAPGPRAHPGSRPPGRGEPRVFAPGPRTRPGSRPPGRARAQTRALKRARSAQSARLRVRGSAESARGKLRRAREARPLSVREALRSSLETLPAKLRSLPEALRSALEALPATLRSVPEALRSALDVLRSAPGHAATSGNWAPAVNRQPGYRRGPRRAPCMRNNVHKSNEKSSENINLKT